MSGTGASQGTYTINLVPPLQSVSPGAIGCPTGPFAGMAVGAIQLAIAQAQNALIAVSTGNQPVMVEYAEGQGKRQVMYTRANADQLRVLIRDLNAALGFRTRKPVWPSFR